MIGAGGTARAIIYEAIKRGAAEVVILNRTVNKAKELAAQFGAIAFGLDYIQELKNKGYDVLINTTSLGMVGQPQISPIPEQAVLPNCVVLDMVSKPKETVLLKMAQNKGCTCIYGEEAFVKQAIAQQQIWFGDKM